MLLCLTVTLYISYKQVKYLNWFIIKKTIVLL
jgi:hypothetical protein